MRFLLDLSPALVLGSYDTLSWFLQHEVQVNDLLLSAPICKLVMGHFHCTGEETEALKTVQDLCLLIDRFRIHTQMYVLTPRALL